MTKEEKSEFLMMARRGAETAEQKKLVEKEQFKFDAKYTYNYVSSLDEFKRIEWMVELFDVEEVKKKYSTKSSAAKNQIFLRNPPVNYYINLIQNICATMWFEQKYDTELHYQQYRIRCLNPRDLNRTQYEWIFVGNRSDLFEELKVNHNGVPRTDSNLIFVTYFEKEFLLAGCIDKDVYNANASFGSAQYGNVDKIIIHVDHYMDQIF